MIPGLKEDGSARSNINQVDNWWHSLADQDRDSHDRTLQSGETRVTPFVWTVRVRTDASGTATVFARNNAFSVGDAISFRTTDIAPSALELMLGAFCADLTATFRSLANRSRITLDALEFSANCTLNNPLMHIGVRGETGHPGIERIEGTLYLSADASPGDLEALWAETLKRSPLFNTLQTAVIFELRLSITP